MARANSFCVILESVRNFLMILSNLYILHLKDIITLLVAQISPFLQSLIKLLFLEKCCIILSNRTKFLVNRTYVCLLGDKYCTIKGQLIKKGWFLMVKKIIEIINRIEDESKLNTIYNFILGLMKKG